jgi:hypothetical protein
VGYILGHIGRGTVYSNNIRSKMSDGDDAPMSRVSDGDEAPISTMRR